MASQTVDVAKETAPAYLHVPHDWKVIRSEGFGPFQTAFEFLLPDGSVRRWTSRRWRKSDLAAAEGGFRRIPGRTLAIASTFTVGSALFALGATSWWSGSVSALADATTYFIGSLFFTTAAYLAYAEVSGTPESLVPGTRRRVRLFSIRPHRIDWWAAAIQLVGTIAFNVSTWFARRADHLAKLGENDLIWWPDVVGSICFLLSSYLSWAEVCHGAGRFRFRDISWWIVVVNLLGSILFGISAVAARYTGTNEVLDPALVNPTTFLGALCFGVAAVMLVPEARRGLEKPALAQAAP
ncbi:MAG: hypothetical protein ACR2OH_03260 [Microthrixaceae bacterium]